jgi:hypothetical protein
MTVGVVLVRRRHCARMSGALTLPHSPRVSRRRSAAARDASPRWLKKDSIRPIRSLVAAAVVRSAQCTRAQVSGVATDRIFFSCRSSGAQTGVCGLGVGWLARESGVDLFFATGETPAPLSCAACSKRAPSHHTRTHTPHTPHTPHAPHAPHTRERTLALWRPRH